jgi:nitrate reductase delta subunit
MTDDRKTLLKLLSLCLAYPDAAAREILPEMETAATGLGDPLARERLTHFIALMTAQPLLDLQAHYTAVFDLNPSASLNLTYHLMGEREDRGRALAELIEVYRRAGFAPTVNDLPDFLPLMLEFLAVSAEGRHNELIRRCLATVPAIAQRLRDSGSMYAAPLELVIAAVPGSSKVDLAPAGRSAAGVSGE